MHIHHMKYAYSPRSGTGKHVPGKTFVIWDKKGQLKDLGIWTLESAKEVITKNSSVL